MSTAIICPKRRVRRLCAEAFGVEEHRLVGARRVREIAVPRQATYYVLRRRFPAMSYPQIGRFMGGRDHSTILHGIRRIEALMARDPELRATIDGLLTGRITMEGAAFDAHVLRWQVERAFVRRRPAPLPAPAPAFDPENELAEFVDPARKHCAQCDRAVTDPERRGCRQRLCPGKAAPAVLERAA